MSRSHTSQISTATRSLAAALSLLLVFIGALAAQPDWHVAFHSAVSAQDLHHHGDHDPVDGDSDSSDAGCAIELYANGGISFSPIDVPIFVPGAGLDQTMILPPETSVSSLAMREPPGRAPPTFL